MKYSNTAGALDDAKWLEEEAQIALSDDCPVASNRLGNGAAHIRSLAAERDRLREVNAELLAALTKLTNEVAGLQFCEDGIRSHIGNTNWEVLQRREAEARAVIAKAESA